MVNTGERRGRTVIGTAAGRSETETATTSAAAYDGGAGGRHGARSGKRERASGWGRKPSNESSGVGGEEGGCDASGVAGEPLEWGAKGGSARPIELQKLPGETTRECKGESSRSRELTPLEWISYPMRTKPLEWPPGARE